MNSDASPIVFAVQSTFLELLELIDYLAKSDLPDKEEELKDEAQRTVLMFIAAIILAGRDYNPAQKSFLSLLVNCEDLPGGEARYLNEYAVKWVEASKQIPGFFDAALRYDSSHHTDITRSMLRQFQIIGNNACASGGNTAAAASQVVQSYIAFLEKRLDAFRTPPIILEATPGMQGQSDSPVWSERIFPTSASSHRHNAALSWIAPNESIDIGVFHIPSGMIYVSDGQPSMAEASAINFRLPVGRPERGEHAPLNYYPQYVWLTPDQRAAYLQWLAAGRKDEDPGARELGYIFLFLYGLERRLLVDNGQEQEVVAEVVRLLHQYGTYTRSRSLQSYAGQLVHFWGWKQGEQYYARLLDWMKTLPISLLADDELAIVLASQLKSDAPLSVELAYEVASRDFASRRSVVVSRVNQEFRELFAKRYLETFPGGMKLICLKQNTRLFYRPASPTLLYGLRNGLSIEVPDVLGAVGQFKPLSAMWNVCIEDLTGYSRARFKPGTSSKNLKAYLALPEELKTSVPHPLAKQWEELLSEGRAGKDCTIIDVGGAAHLIDVPKREKLTPGQSRDLAQTIESLGFVVEPDARHESAYAWDQGLAVFKPIGAKVTPPSQNYLGASVLLKLCVLVAGADGHVAPEELDVSRRFVETKLALSSEDHRRLEALEQVLVADPDRVSGSLARIAKPVPKEQRELICEVLVYVAAADSVVTKDEIRALERIFRAFELPLEKLESHLKSVGPEFGDVTIQEAGDQTPGEPIPRPGQPFRIDMSRVDRIAQETSEVVGILSKVMTEEEPESAEPARDGKSLTPQVSTAPFAPQVKEPGRTAPEWLKSLEPKYQPVLLHLLERASWSRMEFGELAKKSGLMPLDAFDAINGWADENLGDFLLEGEDTILIRKQLIHERN
ncbi:MAG: TerB N-terminal domain-containing protein [Verrucomicrobiota bacterium]|jgi:tellurite resistance protein